MWTDVEQLPQCSERHKYVNETFPGVGNVGCGGCEWLILSHLIRIETERAETPGLLYTPFMRLTRSLVSADMPQTFKCIVCDVWYISEVWQYCFAAHIKWLHFLCLAEQLLRASSAIYSSTLEFHIVGRQWDINGDDGCIILGLNSASVFDLN